MTSDESNSRDNRCSVSNVQQPEQLVTPVIQIGSNGPTVVNIQEVDKCLVTNKHTNVKQDSILMDNQWLSSAFSKITFGVWGKSKSKTNTGEEITGVCIAKRKYEIKDIATYMEKITADWSDLKLKEFKLTMKRVMGNMSAAHRMVSDASQEMITLLDEVELPVWMKLVDMTMHPLVLIEVPEVAIMCEEARQLSKENQQHWNQTRKITEIMEAKNLPLMPTNWGFKVDGRAKKVIAGIIYKYVKDQMYRGKFETPATEVSVKYALNSTTMNRHILGKKYEGGKASGSGTRRPAAVKVTTMKRSVEKSTRDTAEQEDKEERPTKKSKGKGSGKSSRVTRSAQEIRNESTSDQQKQKAKKRKAEEAELEEELNADPDMPSPRERAAALAAKGPTKGGVKMVH